MARTVRSTRRAISPRLATRTLRMRGTGASFTGVRPGLEEVNGWQAGRGLATRVVSDPRRAPILRRRQSALRHQDAPGAAQPEPGRLDLRRRVALHPALHARHRALWRSRRACQLRPPHGGAARDARLLALDASRCRDRRRPLVVAVPHARLAGRARGALPLRARAGDPAAAAPVARYPLGRQDARVHDRRAAARDALPAGALRPPGARSARLRALDAGRLGQLAGPHGAGVGGSRPRMPRGRCRRRAVALPRAALRGPGHRRARPARRGVRLPRRADTARRRTVPARPREPRLRARCRRGGDAQSSEVEAEDVAGAAASRRARDRRPARRLRLRARAPGRADAARAGGAHGGVPAEGRVATAAVPAQGAGWLGARPALPARTLSVRPHSPRRDHARRPLRRAIRKAGTPTAQPSAPASSARPAASPPCARTWRSNAATGAASTATTRTISP